MNTGDQGSVENWLGSATIYNERRDIEENLEEYLLRHTRCGDGECFYSLTEMDQFDVPLDRDVYVLHPCLLDTVSGLTSDRRRPVRPYRTS
jgi:hypothetical protein